MRIAVLYGEKDVLVEISTTMFARMLKENLDNGKSVDDAIEEIIKYLKKEVLKK